MRVFGLFVVFKESSANLNGIDTVFTTPFKGARLGGSTDTLREHDRKVVSVRKIIARNLMHLIITVRTSVSHLREGLKSYFFVSYKDFIRQYSSPSYISTFDNRYRLS